MFYDVSIIGSISRSVSEIENEPLKWSQGTFLYHFDVQVIIPWHPLDGLCMLLQPQRNCKLWLCPSWLCLEVTGLAEPCPMATRKDTRRGHLAAVKAVAKTHIRMLRVNSAENPSDSRLVVQFQGRWSRGYPNLLCLLCLKAVANSNDLVNYGEKKRIYTNPLWSISIHKPYRITWIPLSIWLKHIQRDDHWGPKQACAGAAFSPHSMDSPGKGNLRRWKDLTGDFLETRTAKLPSIYGNLTWQYIPFPFVSPFRVLLFHCHVSYWYIAGGQNLSALLNCSAWRRLPGVGTRCMLNELELFFLARSSGKSMGEQTIRPAITSAFI